MHSYQKIIFVAIFLLLLASIIGFSDKDGVVSDGMSEEKRTQIMQKYLEPPPGKIAKIDEREFSGKTPKTDPLKLRGFIKISPPPGHCFKVTRHHQLPDDIICKPDYLSFRVADIDVAGKISWIISTGKKDFGFRYSWHTPYRLARTILANERPLDLYKPVAIKECIVVKNDRLRQIQLKLINDKIWLINFPTKDRLVRQPPPSSNLFIQKGQSGGITKDHEVSEIVDPEDPKVYEGQDREAWSKDVKKFREDHRKRAFNTEEPIKPVQHFWNIPDRNSFLMPSHHFKTADIPRGMRGQCLYQLNGAPNDPESGWIECHDVDNYDLIFTYLTCTRELGPSPKPLSP